MTEPAHDFTPEELTLVRRPLTELEGSIDARRKELTAEDWYGAHRGPAFSALRRVFLSHFPIDLKLHGLLNREYLSSVQAFTRSSPRLFAPNKYFFLKNHVHRVRPKVVFEFGCGFSTVVIARALLENHRKHGVSGVVHSFEHSAAYHASVEGAIPEQLREFIRFHVCPVRYAEFSGVRGYAYERPELPAEADFAYIDGPAPKQIDGKDFDHFRFDADVYELVTSGTRIHTVGVDVRWFNVAAYEALLGTRYRVDVKRRYRQTLLLERRGA